MILTILMWIVSVAAILWVLQIAGWLLLLLRVVISEEESTETKPQPLLQPDQPLE